MRTFKLFFFTVATLLSFTSCATIFCDTETVPALTINSNVPNARVFLNGKYAGTTPYCHFGNTCNVKKITVKADGYKTKSIRPRKLDGLAYLNFVPSPFWIWGYFVDRHQSECWKYKHDTFDFYLERK